jgi:peptide-methionine (R)-S-oxide reductase
MSCFLHRMQRKEERRSKRQPVKENASAGEVYTCSKCGKALFDAEKKFDAGAGFPSFWEHIEDNVQQNFLNTYGRERIQLLCNGCGSHLGHLFENKKTPTRLRYCIKHEAIELVNEPVTEE